MLSSQQQQILLISRIKNELFLTYRSILFLKFNLFHTKKSEYQKTHTSRT